MLHLLAGQMNIPGEITTLTNNHWDLICDSAALRTRHKEKYGVEGTNMTVTSSSAASAVNDVAIPATQRMLWLRPPDDSIFEKYRVTARKDRRERERLKKNGDSKNGGRRASLQTRALMYVMQQVSSSHSSFDSNNNHHYHHHHHNHDDGLAPTSAAFSSFDDEGNNHSEVAGSSFVFRPRPTPFGADIPNHIMYIASSSSEEALSLLEDRSFIAVSFDKNRSMPPFPPSPPLRVNVRETVQMQALHQLQSNSSDEKEEETS